MDNFIEIYENALSDSLCDLLIDEFEYLHGEAKTFRGTTTDGTDKSIKDSWDYDILKRWKINVEENPETSLTFQDGSPYDITLEKIFESAYDVLGKYDEKYDFHAEFINLEENNFWKSDLLPKVRNKNYLRRCFNLQYHMLIKKYEAFDKQGYHLFHADFDARSNTWLKRSHVIMFYLNDVEEGGETEWYHQKLKVKPKKGTAVVWPAYPTHLHKGHIPISDNKYILNIWVEPNVTKAVNATRWWHN